MAGSIVRGTGTRVYWVQTGGYDTHASQGAQGGGAYATLMGTFGDGLAAFYTDLRNQGLLSDTLVLQFSEFGRRISENGSAGTDHGAAAVMMAMGGAVRGGIYGTAPSLDPDPGNPTLENNGRRRAVRNGLPLGLRARAGQLARCELALRSSEATSVPARRRWCSGSGSGRDSGFGTRDRSGFGIRESGFELIRSVVDLFQRRLQRRIAEDESVPPRDVGQITR